MKSRTILSLVSGLLLAGAVALPATAATTTTSTTTTTTAPVHHTMKKSHAKTVYYVSLVKGKAHACEVVTHRPSKKMMVGKHSYHSHASAAHALAASKLCHA